MAIHLRSVHHPHIGEIVGLRGKADDDAVDGVLHGEDQGGGVCADIEHLEGRAFLFDAVAQGQHCFQQGEKRSGLLLDVFWLFFHVVKPFLLCEQNKHLFWLTSTSRNGRFIWPGSRTNDQKARAERGLAWRLWTRPADTLQRHEPRKMALHLTGDTWHFFFQGGNMLLRALTGCCNRYP